MVEADWTGKGEWFVGKVLDLNEDGTFRILYADGDTGKRVKRDHIRQAAGLGGTSPRPTQRTTGTASGAGGACARGTKGCTGGGPKKHTDECRAAAKTKKKMDSGAPPAPSVAKMKVLMDSLLDMVCRGTLTRPLEPSPKFPQCPQCAQCSKCPLKYVRTGGGGGGPRRAGRAAPPARRALLAGDYASSASRLC